MKNEEGIFPEEGKGIINGHTPMRPIPMAIEASLVAISTLNEKIT